MATHSSILARRIPWTEEPGELQSMGSQRVRHTHIIDIYQPNEVILIDTQVFTFLSRESNSNGF